MLQAFDKICKCWHWQHTTLILLLLLQYYQLLLLRENHKNSELAKNSLVLLILTVG